MVISATPARLDFTAIDVPWRDLPPIRTTLRLGVVAEDPLYPLHPPVRRALDQAVDALRRHGHEVVQLSAETCHVADAAEVAWKLWGLDDRADSVVKAAGEPTVPSRIRIATEAEQMEWRFVPDLSGLDRLDKLSVLNMKRSEISADWHRAWTAHQLDAVIGPPAAHTAVEHDTYGVPAYTNLLNILEVSLSNRSVRIALTILVSRLCATVRTGQ